MTKTHWPAIGLAVICLSLAVLSGTRARTFPPANTDEAFLSVLGFNDATHADPRYSLFDNVFAPSIYSLRDAFPISAVGYSVFLGHWIKGFGKGLYVTRLSSLALGVATLILLYLIGCRIQGPPLGLLLAALLAVNPVFALSTLVVRTEALLLFTSTLIVWLMLKIPDRMPWKAFWIGCLIGGQTGVHPNAVALCPALMILYFGTDPTRRPLKHLPLIILGIAAGGVLAFLPVNMERYLLSHKLFWYDLAKPPAFTWPWAPGSWIYHTLACFIRGDTFYLKLGLVPGWPLAFQAFWSALALCGIASLLDPRPRVGDSRRRWLISGLYGTLVTIIGLAFMVQRKEVLYAVSLFPFLIPWMGLVFSVPPRWNEKAYWLTRIGAALLLITGGASFWAFTARYEKTCRPYETVLQDVRAHLPGPDSRFTGPNVLWFGQDSDTFRDIGASVYSHWFTGGKRDLGDWFKPWAPEVMVVDEGFKHTFLGTGPTAPALSRILKIPVEPLGTVDTGEGASGVFEIFRLRWPKTAS